MTPSKKQKPDGLLALLDPEMAICQLAAHLARLNGNHPHDYESSIWRRMCSAIRRGDLPIRAFPLWDKVAPGEAFREDGGLYGYSEKRYALSVADLHKWMVDGGMPTTANAKGLWEILKQEEDSMPETQTGTQEDVTPEDQADGQTVTIIKKRDGALKLPTRAQLDEWQEKFPFAENVQKHKACEAFAGWLKIEGYMEVTGRTLEKWFDWGNVTWKLKPNKSALLRGFETNGVEAS